MLSKLPPELLFEIISYLAPATGIIFAPRSTQTKDLLAMTLVCKATHDIANKILIQRCLFLRSANAADCLAKGLLTTFSRANEEKNGLVLEPTQATLDIDPPNLDGQAGYHGYLKVWLPHVYHLHVNMLDTLFSRVGHCLTRLVLNIKLHLHPSFMKGRQIPDDTKTRDAFKHLKVLEEFYCIEMDGNYLFEDEDTPIWINWPKLRRLALSDIKISSESFLEGLCSLRHLTHLFLANPKSLDAPIRVWACCGSQTIQKIIIVQVDFGTWIEPHYLVRDNTFLGQMKKFRMDRLVTTPGRIQVLSLPPDLRPWTSATGWFDAQVKRGTLWDGEHAKSLKTRLEI